MKNHRSVSTEKILAVIALSVFVIGFLTACDDHFYMSENEAAALTSVLVTDQIANQTFDNLRGRSVNFVFDNTTGTPKLVGSQLLQEMRRTELQSLEGGTRGISLPRLVGEFEDQIGKWAEDRLELYTSGSTADRTRLDELYSVNVRFRNNPTFVYRPSTQKIDYQVSLRVVMIGKIHVNSVNWLVNFFTRINGDYKVRITIPSLQLNGQADLYSPYADAGRIRLKMTPRIAAPVEVRQQGPDSVPGAVRNGVAKIMTRNLSKSVNHVFTQKYYHFSLPRVMLSRGRPGEPSKLQVHYGSRASWLGPDDVPPELHVVTRDKNGKLFHGRRRMADWERFVEIAADGAFNRFPNVESDPALFHSGRGQLELGATGYGGSFLYSHWRNENWVESHVVKPFQTEGTRIAFSGKPAIVATAPGQVEVVVRGSDGALWHLRRIDGNWNAPKRVPVVQFNPLVKRPFRDPSVVVVGNRMVVVFVDNTKRPAAIAYDFETGKWGQATRFSNPRGRATTSEYAISAVATGERNVHVAYANNGGFVLHQILEIQQSNFTAQGNQTGITFRGRERKITGATTNSAPVLTCATFGQPELIIRDQNNRILQNHYFYGLGPEVKDGRTLNPGWQGWVRPAEGFFRRPPKYPLEVAGFSATGTRTGKTTVAAISLAGRQLIPNRIFYNQYESGRYERKTAPWKTVHWRGWQLSDPQEFKGTPSVVSVDRNFQAVHPGIQPGRGASYYLDRLGRTNATYAAGNSQTIRTSQSGVDPLVLSSGPGLMDVFTVRNQRTVEHSRNYFSRGTGRINPLTVPAGTTVTAISAISYGNGAVELAVQTSNRRVYTWRYRTGDWTRRRLSGSDVASEPVLAYLGDGRFDLYWVNSGGRLMRRRFRGGAWSSAAKLGPGTQIQPQLFSSSSVFSYGDGTIDMVVARFRDRELYFRRFGRLLPPCTSLRTCPADRRFQKVGGKSSEDPVVTSFGPASINVLAMRGLSWFSSNTTPFRASGSRSRRSTPLVLWKAFEPIGGSELVVSGTAHTGRDNFMLIGTKGGRLVLNRNVNDHWSGFRFVAGQDENEILRTPILLPSIASHGEG